MNKKLIVKLGILIGAGFILMSQKDAIADLSVKGSDEFTKWDPLLKEFASKYGLNWTWLKAIMWNESSLGRAPSVVRGLQNPADEEGSKSSDGKSWGLMQVTLSTARDLRPGTTTADLNNPRISVDLSAKYLSQMLKRYGGDISRAVRAYNQGPGNEDKGKPYADEYLARFNAHLEKVWEAIV